MHYGLAVILRFEGMTIPGEGGGGDGTVQIFIQGGFTQRSNTF